MNGSDEELVKLRHRVRELEQVVKDKEKQVRSLIDSIEDKDKK